MKQCLLALRVIPGLRCVSIRVRAVVVTAFTLPRAAGVGSSRRFGGISDPECRGREKGDSACQAKTARVVRRFVEEVINGGNLDLADELIAPDHRNHDPTAPEVGEGPEGVKELIGAYRSAFPDLRFEIGEIFSSADGAAVAHRWTMTGTHEGEMMGIEPTGRRVEVMGVEINHERDNRISASRTLSDAVGLMRQPGAP